MRNFLWASVFVPLACCQPLFAAADASAELMKIEIVIGDTVLSGQLYDNPTARDFAAMLPLNVELSDYAQTEKVADLSRKLTTQSAPIGYAASLGDITYYAPWGNLAIFYREFQFANGLIHLGHIDYGMDELRKPGKMSVVVRKAQYRTNSSD